MAARIVSQAGTVEQISLFETPHFTATPRGLVVSGQPAFDEWASVGRRLYAMGNGAVWCLGDWLRYGEGRGDWGESYSQAIDETQRSYQTLADAAWVAGVFQFSRRRENLSWSHHREVAGLPPGEADAFLDQAEAERCGHKALRERVREQRYLARTAERAWPPGQYGVIYCDPPWQPDAGVLDPTRQIENQYPTMSLEDLIEMAPRVKAITAPDAVLLMWVVAQKLEEACALWQAWGFRCVSGAVWVKDSIGMGYWFRSRHELLVVATKGHPPPPRESVRADSVIEADRRGHSQKPDEVYTLVDAMFPGVPIVELFARSTPARPLSWATWGNEAVA